MEEDFKIDFIGIGAEKCATTWIADSLAEHPQICTPLNRDGKSEKGIYFFNMNYNYRRGIEYYASFFSHCEKDKIRGEFSTRYIYNKQSAERIFRHFPEAKIIISIRNPIERAFSRYRADEQLKGFLTVYKSFEKAIEGAGFLTDRGLYYKHLKPYFDLFPRDNILVLTYDDLKKDSLSFIQSVYRFLGVDENFVPSSITERGNATGMLRKECRFGWLNFILQNMTRIASERSGIFKQESLLYRILDKTRIRQLWLYLLRWNQKEIKGDGFEASPEDSIDPRLRKELNNFFREDINNLQKLINRNLNAWKK